MPPKPQAAPPLTLLCSHGPFQICPQLKDLLEDSTAKAIPQGEDLPALASLQSRLPQALSGRPSLPASHGAWSQDLAMSGGKCGAEGKDCFQEGSPELERLDPGLQGSWWRQSQACPCLCKCAWGPRQDVGLPGCGTLGRFLIVKMGGRPQKGQMTWAVSGMC